MKFKKAKKLLLIGKRIRRRAWRPGCFIFTKDNSPFIWITYLQSCETQWQPYVDDFKKDASDWEEFISARVFVLWNGTTREMPRQVPFDIDTDELLATVTVAIDGPLTLPGFVVDRFRAAIHAQHLWPIGVAVGDPSAPVIFIRPKAPF